MTLSVIQLREVLKVPERGRIDFHETLGLGLSDLLDHWRGGHLPMVRTVVHEINFDDVPISQGGDYAEVIDRRYKTSHGVEFVAYKHTYDTSTGLSGFEPAQGGYFGYDQPRWVEPHVFAVGDHGSGPSHLALSEPNAINVNGITGDVSGQCLRNDDAIRINFDPPAGVVKIDTQCWYLPSDVPQVTGNWPMLQAYDADGNLLDEMQAPYATGTPARTLCVSSWANDIAYVMVTVNNHFHGDGPVAVFDNLVWTTIEFVLRSLQALREAPPVARGAWVDPMAHRIQALQRTQQRLQDRLAQVAEGGLAAQLQDDMAALTRQTEALKACYRKATGDTANRSAAHDAPTA